MHPLLTYLLKSIACSGLLMLYYMVFLRGQRMHAFNRFYLLTTVVISLVFPLLEFQWLSKAPAAAGVYRLLTAINGGDEIVTEVAGAGNTFDYFSFVVTLYCLVGAVLLTFLVKSISAVYRLRNRSEISDNGDYLLIDTDVKNAPFSFLNMLFWRKDMDRNSTPARLVLQHELVHIRQYHTLDKLFMRIITAVCWINPVYWWIQKELALVHEYLADDKAIESRDTEAFAHMLLSARYKKFIPEVTHPFFSSPTKKRLLMLQQTNPTWKKLRGLLVLPLIGGMLLLFSFKAGQSDVVRANKNITLALDAGHGGKDAGPKLNGHQEKDLNLKIAKKLAVLAPQYNITIREVRPDDNYVTLEDRAANAANADLFLSVHMNATGKGSAPGKGFEIMLAKDGKQYEESRKMGSAIASVFQSVNWNTKLIDKGLVVLRSVNVPAVLIECGYMDNAEDLARITNEQQLEAMCRKILSGVVAYQNGR